MPATFAKLISAAEFQSMPGGDRPTELVRGRIVELDFGVLRHGQVCSQIDWLFGRYLDEQNLGHLVCNDVGVQTEHDPDTVRGMDIAFLSYSRYPKGPLPDELLSTAPNVLWEVASPSDPWTRLFAEIGGIPRSWRGRCLRSRSRLGSDFHIPTRCTATMPTIRG